MKEIFSYVLYMNINYKTQAMIRYLFNKVLRKNNTGVTQKWVAEEPNFRKLALHDSLILLNTMIL